MKLNREMNKISCKISKVNHVKNFIALLLTIGFPVVPLIGIPFFPIVILFYIGAFFKQLICYKKLINSLFLLSFFYFLLSVVLASEIQDFLFSVKLLIKLWLAYAAGLFVAIILMQTPKILSAWLFVQVLLVALSAFIEPVYIFLLNFMSIASRDVFVHIYGLRALGFGLYHVDGGVTLAFMAFIPFMLKLRESMKLLNYISFFSSLLLARSAIIFLLIAYILKRPFFLFFMVLLLIFFSIYVPEEWGSVYQAVEIFRNIYEKGELMTSSTSANLNMFILPDNIFNYLYGFGYYFDDGGLFFKGTDLGWFRILLFGGVLYLLIYIFLNLLPIVNIGREVFSVFMFVTLFVILNFKGIFILPFFVMVYVHLKNNLAKDGRIYL